MSEQIPAVFDNGVFRPVLPVHLPQGQSVIVFVGNEPAPRMAGDAQDDFGDLLDYEYIEQCRKRTLGRQVPSINDVRRALSSFQGNISDLISEEREER